MNKNLIGVLLGLVLVIGCIECVPQKQWWQSLNIVSNNANNNIKRASAKAGEAAKPVEVKFIPDAPEQQQKYNQVHTPHFQQPQASQIHKPVELSPPAVHMPVQYVPEPQPQHPIAPIFPTVQVVEQRPVHVHNIAPFQIQKPVLSHTGELIIENTLGGVDFDCRFLPTGHWRDGNFCDVYHACVHGYHRKTYTCPIVGERTYFDEVTQRCEFVRFNPAGCSSDRFVR